MSVNIYPTPSSFIGMPLKANLSILAGTYKGTRLKMPDSAGTRPTSARVRKSLFDMLGDLSGSSVLDMFSGSGALGFEAASRGAVSVTFVDNGRRAVESIRKNGLLFHGVNLDFIRQDVFRFLKQCNSSFDLILADPPYEKVNLNRLTDQAIKRLGSGGRLVIESSVREKWNSEGARVKKYGDTQISIFST